MAAMVTDVQLGAIHGSVRSAFSVLSSADIEALVKEPYDEFRQSTAPRV